MFRLLFMVVAPVPLEPMGSSIRGPHPRGPGVRSARKPQGATTPPKTSPDTTGGPMIGPSRLQTANQPQDDAQNAPIHHLNISTQHAPRLRPQKQNGANQPPLTFFMTSSKPSLIFYFLQFFYFSVPVFKKKISVPTEF